MEVDTGKAVTSSMTLVPPTLVRFGVDGGSPVAVVEVSLHKPNPSLKRELALYLHAALQSSISLRDAGEVLVLATCQESRADLLSWDEAAAAEKDRLLLSFQRFAEDLCAYLRGLGFWADYADPASGLLMQSPGQVVWPEVQALERLRGYRKSTAGPCHILLHPQWQSRMYPASLFTNAPESVVRAKLGV